MLAKLSQEEKQKIATRIEDMLEKDDISETVKKELQIFRIGVKLSLGD